MKFFTSPLVLAFWRQKLLARKSRPGGNAGKKLPATRGSRTMPYSVRKEKEKKRKEKKECKKEKKEAKEKRKRKNTCELIEVEVYEPGNHGGRR